MKPRSHHVFHWKGTYHPGNQAGNWWKSTDVGVRWGFPYRRRSQSPQIQHGSSWIVMDLIWLHWLRLEIGVEARKKTEKKWIRRPLNTVVLHGRFVLEMRWREAACRPLKGLKAAVLCARDGSRPCFYHGNRRSLNVFSVQNSFFKIHVFFQFLKHVFICSAHS